MRTPGFISGCAFALLLAAMPGAHGDDVTKLYQQGYNAMHAREYGLAVKLWSGVLALDPKDATACKNRALAYEALKDWDNAAKDAAALVKIAPDDPAGYEMRADIYDGQLQALVRVQGWYRNPAHITVAEQAIADYTEAFRLDSLHQQKPGEWARRESMSGPGYNQEKEIAGFNVALMHEPENKDMLFMRADFYSRLRLWDRAEADYSALLKLDPANARALQGRARSYGGKLMDNPKPDKETAANQLADLSERVRLSSTRPNYLERGDFYSKQGDYDRAMADYQQVLALSGGKDNGAYEGMAEIYEAGGDWQKAIQSYNHIIDTHDYGDLCNHNAIYDYRATLYMEAGEYEKAIADLNKGMEGQLTSMVVIRAQDKTGNGPADALEKDEQFNRESMEYYLVQRGEAWQRAGSYDKALADFDNAITTNPKGRRGLGMKAWLRATCADAKYRNGAAAMELAMKACTLGGWEKPGDIDTLAAACAEDGKWGDAVAYEKMAVKVDQEIPAPQEHSAATEKKRVATIQGYNARQALYEQKKQFRGAKELMDWEE